MTPKDFAVPWPPVAKALGPQFRDQKSISRQIPRARKSKTPAKTMLRNPHPAHLAGQEASELPPSQGCSNKVTPGPGGGGLLLEASPIYSLSAQEASHPTSWGWDPNWPFQLLVAASILGLWPRSSSLCVHCDLTFLSACPLLIEKILIGFRAIGSLP